MVIRCLEFQRPAINIDPPFNNLLAGEIARRQVQPLDYRTGGVVKFKTRLVGNRKARLGCQIEV